MTPDEKAQWSRDRAMLRDMRLCCRRLLDIFAIDASRSKSGIAAKKASAERKLAQRYEDLPGAAQHMMTRAALESDYTVADLMGRSAAVKVCRVREQAIWGFREAGYSLPQIGRMFGGRHHTTIMHALKNEERRRDAA